LGSQMNKEGHGRNKSGRSLNYLRDSIFECDRPPGRRGV